MLYDQAVVRALHKVFDSYIVRAKPVEFAVWRQRFIGTKLIENIARLTSALP